MERKKHLSPVTKAYYSEKDFLIGRTVFLGGFKFQLLSADNYTEKYMNDNPDQFWPAELERQHGTSVQAINQGVGGWTTLHIRRFLETRVEDVDPDVVVLYIGHNDLMTESIRPYGELYAAWQRGTDLSITVSGALSNVPLYQLMRSAHYLIH